VGLPRSIILVCAVALVVPWLVLALVFTLDFRLDEGTHWYILAPLWLRVPLKLCLVLAIAFARVPVEVDSEQIRHGWFYRLRWADVVDARIRHVFGFRTLELVRRNGRPWRLLLGDSDRLPLFLARHAPIESTWREHLGTSAVAAPDAADVGPGWWWAGVFVALAACIWCATAMTLLIGLRDLSTGEEVARHTSRIDRLMGGTAATALATMVFCVLGIRERQRRKHAKGMDT
jgi:hypothetical protein